MDGITNLIMAMTAFVGTHLVLSHPLRATLVRKFGPSGFLGAIRWSGSSPSAG